MDDMKTLKDERVKSISSPSAQPTGPSYFQTFGAGRQQPGFYSPEPVPPPRPRGEWFVAIGAVQIGPLSLAEVEERWYRGEINSQTLVWKAGFADWMALAVVPELYHLSAQAAPTLPPPMPSLAVPPGVEEPPAEEPAPEPAPEPAAEAAAAPQPEPEPKKEESYLEELSKASAMPEAGEKEAAEEEWKPSAGSALASLVDEEQEALKKVDEAPPAPMPFEAPSSVPPVPGMPEQGAEHVSSVPFPQAQYQKPYVRQMPTVARREEPKSKNWLLFVIVAVISAASAAAGGMAVYKFMAPAYVPPPPPPPPVVAKVEEKKPEPPPPPPVEKKAEEPAKEQAAEPEQAAEKKPEKKLSPEEAERRRAAAAEAKKRREEERKKAAEQKKAAAERPVPVARAEEERPAKRPSKRECDPVLDPDCGGGGGSAAASEPPRPPPKPAVPDSLDQQQVLEVIKANMMGIKSCMNQQAEKDPALELTGKILVTWEIQPNGRPSKVRVETEKFQGTFLASCISGVVDGFMFPKFNGEPIPIRFPFKLKGQ
jgi:hypothetical protein